MPLVRVSGNDGLGFDVAKMTDNVRSNSSSTRNSNNSRGKNNNNNFSPTTPDTFDDLTSLDTSSGRHTSDEIDRFTNSTSRGSFHAGGARRRGSNSNMSIGSTSNNAYHNYNSPLNGDGSDNNINDSYEKLQSSYMDNLDHELQNDNNDPRKNNPSFNPGRHNSLVTVGTGWSPNDYIPEEDETSLSTLDEESVTPSSNNHSSSYTSNNYQNSSQHMQYHHQQPPQNRLSHRQQKSESDDGSISTHQSFKHKSSRDSFNNNYRRGSSRESENSQRIISQQQQLISQLESQVMKLNLELATTKSSLDEIQLQNRKLNDDKSKLTSKMREVQEENGELHIIIERLEKEKILRNMDGTRGTIVATTNTNDGGGGRNSRRLTNATGTSCVVWDGTSVSGNTWADTYTVTQQKLGKVGGIGGGGLEVPFRTAKPRRSSVSSFSTVGDDMSRGDISCNSVALSSCDNSNDEKLEHSYADSTGGVLLTADDDDEENMSTSQRSQGLNLLGMFGGGKKNKQNQKQQSTEEITKQMEETFVSSLSPVHSKGDTYTDDDDNLESSFSNQRSQSQSGEVEIGSNPQGETFNDDDPFSTWSAPGDPKRKKEEPEKNWLQRGLKGGGRGGGRDSSQQPSSSQSKDEIEDPFYVCNGSAEENNETERYTSFAATNSSECDASDTSNGGANGKRFGLFKGFGKGR